MYLASLISIRLEIETRLEKNSLVESFPNIAQIFFIFTEKHSENLNFL